MYMWKCYCLIVVKPIKATKRWTARLSILKSKVEICMCDHVKNYKYKRSLCSLQVTLKPVHQYKLIKVVCLYQKKNMVHYTVIRRIVTCILTLIILSHLLTNADSTRLCLVKKSNYCLIFCAWGFQLWLRHDTAQGKIPMLLLKLNDLIQRSIYRQYNVQSY